MYAALAALADSPAARMEDAFWALQPSCQKLGSPSLCCCSFAADPLPLPAHGPPSRRHLTAAPSQAPPIPPSRSRTSMLSGLWNHWWRCLAPMGLSGRLAATDAASVGEDGADTAASTGSLCKPSHACKQLLPMLLQPLPLVSLDPQPLAACPAAHPPPLTATAALQYFQCKHCQTALTCHRRPPVLLKLWVVHSHVLGLLGSLLLYFLNYRRPAAPRARPSQRRLKAATCCRLRQERLERVARQAEALVAAAAAGGAAARSGRTCVCLWVAQRLNGPCGRCRGLLCGSVRKMGGWAGRRGLGVHAHVPIKAWQVEQHAAPALAHTITVHSILVPQPSGAHPPPICTRHMLAQVVWMLLPGSSAAAASNASSALSNSSK